MLARETWDVGRAPTDVSRITFHEVGGFTLVELLVAATMLSVLFVGLGAHLRGGVSVWRRTTALTERLQRERVVWDLLARDLANAVPYTDGRDDGFAVAAPVFGATELSWVAVQPDGAGAAALQVVRYACESHDDVSGLWRMRHTISEARTGADPRGTLLRGDCRRLEVRYGYAEPGVDELAWDTVWRYPEDLPQVLDVTLELDTDRTLTQRLVLPAGVLKPLTEGET